MNEKTNIGVLALGNLLRQDEGVGLHLLELLRKRLPSDVELMDGGTSGMALLGFLERQKRLIVLDAVDAGRQAGEIIEWREDQVPRYTTGKLSMHQMSFAEVLYWAHFTGGVPEEIVVIGVQPESLNWGTELTATAKQSLPAAVRKVLTYLKDWGTPVRSGRPIRRGQTGYHGMARKAE